MEGTVLSCPKQGPWAGTQNLDSPVLPNIERKGTSTEMEEAENFKPQIGVEGWI